MASPDFITAGNGRPLNLREPGRHMLASEISTTDLDLIERLSHFNRERIPERVVHAKGAGAFGTFEVTHDISDICSIDMLLGIGKKTDCTVRFSTTAGERGSADALRDPRGMAVKFKTDQGVWDWVWNNVPFFFIRDPAKFVDLVHSQKRNPSSNLRDPEAFWQFVVQNQESMHMIMWMFSEYGAFNSFRHMNSYQGNPHRWVMPDGSFKYVHMFLTSDQGHRFNTDAEIANLSGTNTDYATKDLYDAIERGDFPTWTAIVQVIDPEEIDRLGYNIFDMTKHWDMGTYPKDRGLVDGRTFGKLTLNRNPENFFQDIEQAAFSPSHLVPGIEPGPDPILQARLFAYPDAQRHRLGVNYQHLPTNAPKQVNNPFQRDGAANAGKTSRNTKFGYTHPSAYRLQQDEAARRKVSGDFFELDDNDFHFPRGFWNHLPEKYPGWQEKFITNVSNNLYAASLETRTAVYALFHKVDDKLGFDVEKSTEERLARNTKDVGTDISISKEIQRKRQEDPDHHHDEKH